MALVTPRARIMRGGVGCNEGADWVGGSATSSDPSVWRRGPNILHQIQFCVFDLLRMISYLSSLSYP